MVLAEDVEVTVRQGSWELGGLACLCTGYGQVRAMKTLNHVSLTIPGNWVWTGSDRIS